MRAIKVGQNAFDAKHKGLEDISRKVKLADVPQWKINKSEGDSLYILDPDGHKMEIHVGSLESRLASLRANPYDGLVWLDGSQT